MVYEVVVVCCSVCVFMIYVVCRGNFFMKETCVILLGLKAGHELDWVISIEKMETSVHHICFVLNLVKTIVCRLWGVQDMVCSRHHVRLVVDLSPMDVHCHGSSRWWVMAICSGFYFSTFRLAFLQSFLVEGTLCIIRMCNIITPKWHGGICWIAPRLFSIQIWRHLPNCSKKNQ